MRLYDEHDMFVFPSLHDSTGWVVLESLCKGLPVACLDLGGPKDIVTPDCGIIVQTRGLATSGVAERMADQLHNALSDPVHMATLSAGAIRRAKDFLLTAQITKFYETAQRMIAERSVIDHTVLSVSLPAQPQPVAE